ncbi:MAG TPA: ABC transporter ATP-binding protein [Solirubrobacteraceae bacterium]
MSSPVIHMDGLAKRYRIGVQTASHGRLTESMWNGITSLFGRGHAGELSDHVDERDFWALRGVDLDVYQGDVLGIVGRNGAGKTTLLKILSRITEPTEGYAELRGRVGALLEVGTGFHPELTGRENIFLNGGILGMSRQEIRSKFDEIVEFAEVQKFIDTPVKRYSSGMFVRLAFAVAAHLEPEVLIIDEVLAVGDINFQRKCLGKMGDVAREGRTVIFVSHNTGAVAELCTRAVLLEGGHKMVDGSVQTVLDAYAELMANRGGGTLDMSPDPTLPASVVEVAIEDAAARRASSFDLPDDIDIVVRYRVVERVHGFQLVVSLARNAVRLVHTFDTDDLDHIPARDPGLYEARYRVPGMTLKAGLYTVDVDTGTLERHMQTFEAAASFEIEERTVNAHSKGYRRDRPGHLVALGAWSTKRVADA